MRTLAYVVTAAILAIAASPIASAHAKEAESKANAPYDIQFLDTMSQHHRDGLPMLEMAVDKATAPEIKRIAQKSIDDQNKDIEKMAGLRKSVDVDAVESVNMKLPGMMPKSKMEEDMSMLQAASGNAFDKLFLQTMIAHHRGGVKMADDALVKATHAGVKAKAQDIHDKQKQEIADMQDMLKGMK